MVFVGFRETESVFIVCMVIVEDGDRMSTGTAPRVFSNCHCEPFGTLKDKLCEAISKAGRVLEIATARFRRASQ